MACLQLCQLNQRESQANETNPAFLERYDADPEITLSNQNIIATFSMVLIKEEWSSSICAYLVTVWSPAVTVYAYWKDLNKEKEK